MAGDAVGLWWAVQQNLLKCGAGTTPNLQQTTCSGILRRTLRGSPGFSQWTMDMDGPQLEQQFCMEHDIQIWKPQKASRVSILEDLVQLRGEGHSRVSVSKVYGCALYTWGHIVDIVIKTATHIPPVLMPITANEVVLHRSHEA